MKPDRLEVGRMAAEPGPKHVNIAVFDPKKDIFLISMVTKNIPGVLGDIATRVGKAGINILSISNYSEPGNPESNLSFFAEPSTRSVTEEEFSKILYSSPYVLGVYARKTEDGFAVNDYNFPLTYYPGGRGVIFPVSGMASMFSDLVSLFGSGGEMILFRAGYAVGRQGAEQLSKLFGEENMLVTATAYTRLVNALGWGRMEVLDMDKDVPGYTVRVFDSFECAGRRAGKPTGHFLRGMIAGSAERLIRKPVSCAEIKCTATGSQFCLFQLEAENPTAVEP